MIVYVLKGKIILNSFFHFFFWGNFKRFKSHLSGLDGLISSLLVVKLLK